MPAAEARGLKERSTLKGAGADDQLPWEQPGDLGWLRPEYGKTRQVFET
jgi:hypothetical protein